MVYCQVFSFNIHERIRVVSFLRYYTLCLNNDCKTSCPSVKIAKFADDTTIVGLISDKDETAVYRQEISELVNWCSIIFY